MTGLLLLVLVVGAVGVLVALGRNERVRRAGAAATVELEVDALGVRRVLADGREEAVHWDELTEVEVITTKVGVHKDDGAVLVLAGDGERGCLVPSGLARAEGVLERVAGLPGVDVRRLAEALEASPPSRTTVWTRQ